MGKNPNSFQKRQRELDKKRKAEDKRKRRQAQKHATANLKTIVMSDKDETPDDAG
jgi:hypothetical protein